MKKRVSIIVPAYNEAEGVSTFHNKILLPELDKLSSYIFDITYVDDGSSDDTLARIKNLRGGKHNTGVLSFSKNFGKEIATTAGLHHAKGDCAIALDADGQHPPSELKAFLDKWSTGAKVVVGVRKSTNHETYVKKVGSKLFYAIFNKSSDINLVPGSTDYRLIDRQVLDEFNKFSEKNRITRGIIDWLGFKRDFVYFDSPSRLAGEATYKTSQLINLAVNSFVSLSIRPLVWLVYIGLATVTLSILLLALTSIEALLLGDPLGLNPTGSAYLAMFMMLLVGVVLVSQGVMSIYISRIHEQTQARPLYVIDHENSIIN